MCLALLGYPLRPLLRQLLAYFLKVLRLLAGDVFNCLTRIDFVKRCYKGLDGVHLHLECVTVTRFFSGLTD
jgi:hypothetical protein